MRLAGDLYNAFVETGQAVVPNLETGPLAGLRLAVKDIYDVEGLVTGWGNPRRLAQAKPAAASAWAVGALLDSGAGFVGKTQTDELAFSLFGQNAHLPFPINPAAPGRITGGSSSGSAAAVAGRLADIALGSDTGGSIRAPASFCGLIGLRTTHGAIPLDGVMPLAPSFDTVGWFARDIEVYGRVADVLLGGLPPAESNGPPGASPSPLRGGSARSAGAGVEPMEPPPPRPLGNPPRKGEGEARHRFVRLAQLDMLFAGAAEQGEYARMISIVSGALCAPTVASALPFAADDLYWTFRILQAREAWLSHGEWISAADRQLGAGVAERFAFGSTISKADETEHGAKRRLFRAALADLLGDDGVLVLPTVPSAAPLTGSSAETLNAFRERALKLLCWSGLSGFPQITLPLGTIDGAPFGLSLLGPAGSDRSLIALGATLLAARNA